MYGELLTNWEYDPIQFMDPCRRWLLSGNPLTPAPEMIPFDFLIEKKFGKLIKKHLCQAVEYGFCNPKKGLSKNCKPGTYYLKYPKILFFERTACARESVYPEIYHGKEFIDAEVFAKRLGLKVYYRRFTRDGREEDLV